MEKCLIYLADLAHNYSSNGPFTFPINIGYVAAYAKKLYGDKIQIKLFKFPQDLIDAVKYRLPHIIGFANYTWNLDINNKISSWCKALSKDIVTVFGGPDYPASNDERKLYLRSRPDLDFYVIGQGEKGFSNILERFLNSRAIKEMKASPICNCSFYDSKKNTVIAECKYEFIEDLSQIPSPYLEGFMDPFFNGNLNPLVETNRGCPYLCTYCAWGASSQKRIFQFPLERVKQEIEYIARRVKNTDMLMICDANFGILARDIEISKFIKASKETHGYPSHIFIAWAKSGSQRLIKMIDNMGDIFGMTSTFGSFQTLDPIVMKNIKRTNLSLVEFKHLQDYLKNRGISTSSELILGLPGETKETHLKALRDMFDFNAASIVCYNLRMIGGSELNTRKNRKRFGIKTRYRLIDGGFGRYDSIVSIEHEEIVLATGSMTTRDILYFRPIHFLIQFLWDYRYYEELLIFLKNSAINPIDFIITIIDNINSAPLVVKNLFDSFKRDTYDEWFKAKEELYRHYSKPENFQTISKGGFGKLNYKYTYKILLECRKEFDEYLFKSAVIIMGKNKKTDETQQKQLEDIFKYLESIYVDFSKKNGKLKTVKCQKFTYDILKWKMEAYKNPLAKYFYPGTRLYFWIPKEQKVKLHKLCCQYKGKDLNQTLRKMAEYMNEQDLFYKARHSLPGWG